MRDLSGGCALSVALILGSAMGTFLSTRAQDAAAKQQKSQVTLTESQLDGVVGVYGNAAEPETEISIAREGTRLFAEGERSPRFELIALTPDRLVTLEGLGEIDLTRDASGQVTGFSPKGLGQIGPVMQRLEGKPRKLNNFHEYTKQEVMVPARDGVKLHVVIFLPSNKETVGSETTGEPLPFLMMRTPYGVDEFTSDRINAGKPELAASGYIFVLWTFAADTGAKGSL